MQHEVTTAIARGITGFAFDVMSVDQATNASSELHLMLAAAQAVDSRFKIMVMPDITALGNDFDGVLKIIQSVAKSPSAYKLADGRLVVSAFAANLNSPYWWQSLLLRLKNAGINVAFVPTFLGWTQYADLYKSMAYGYADWGTATAHASSLLEDDPSIAHGTFDKIFMMPVDSQQFRPKNFQYCSRNSAAFRRLEQCNSRQPTAQLVTGTTIPNPAKSRLIPTFLEAHRQLLRPQRLFRHMVHRHAPTSPDDTVYCREPITP